MEKEKKLKLLYLNSATGEIRGTYPLGLMNQSLALKPLRRIQAAHLASSGGVMVCPTNAGMILGVDLPSGNLAWSYTYREPGTPVPERPLKVTAPIIIGDKLVFSAPDSPDISCLRLKDGKLQWKEKAQPSDVYLGGVVGGKVLVVGREEVRALNLETGAQVWNVKTGMPSGLGAAAGDRYYVPMCPDGKCEPAIAVLDVTKGIVVELLRTKDDMVPGNLVFAGGVLVSQSATELQIFPLRHQDRPRQ